MIRKNIEEVLNNIKNIMPYFKKDELLDYAKWAVINLHNSIRDDNEKLFANIREDILNKVKTNKGIYRTSNDIDHITIQYVDLYDCVETENNLLIKVYLSVYFYDNTGNNEFSNGIKNKYWNDVWIVTFVEKDKKKISGNCPNCGAVMTFDEKKEIFKCSYCDKIIHFREDTRWEIVDIEVEK